MEKEEFQNETLDEVYEYRGVKVEIWNDDYGQQKFIKFIDPVLEEDEISLGSFNCEYKEDIKYIIDHKLDTICYFDNFPGAKLSWFENGYSNRDIKLEYRTRMIKLFLVEDESKVDMNEIKKISEEALSTFHQFTK